MRYFITLIAAILITFTAINSKSNKEDLFPMQKNFQWGYINSSGDWVIEPQFDWAVNFREGRAFVSDSSGKVFVIDKSGKIVYTFKDKSWGTETNYGVTLGRGPQGYSEGLLHKDNGEYLDKDGNTAFKVDCKYCSNFGQFNNGLAPFEKKDKYGYINKKGEIVIEPKFDDAIEFSEGMAAVSIREETEGSKFGAKKWGFINTDGEIVVKPQYNNVGDFHNGLALFHTKNERRKTGYYSLIGFINTKGDTVIEPQFKPFDAAERFSEGLYPAPLVDTKMGMGYINTKGETVIKPEYENADLFSDGLAFVKKETKNRNDKGYFIDKKGNVVIEGPLLDTSKIVGQFRNGLAKIAIDLYGKGGYSSSGSGDYRYIRNAYYAYIDKKGNVVKIQSEDEREYMRSVIDSIKNAEELAEKREEERKQRAIEEKLKDCPEFIEYGDKNSNSFITLNMKGKKRIMYFDTPVVEKRKTKYGDELYVYFPLFGLNREDRERLKESAGGGLFSGMVKSYYDNLSKLKIELLPDEHEKFKFIDKKMTFLDCMKDVPGDLYDQLWDKYDSERTLKVEEKDGKYHINFKTNSKEHQDNYFSGEIVTNKIVKKDYTSDDYKYTDENGNKQIEKLIEYYPNQRMIKYPSRGLMSSYKTIKLPEDDSKLFTERSDQHLVIYKINELSDEKIDIEKHGIDLIKNDEEWKNSIFEPPFASNLDPNEYELNDSTLERSFSSSNIITLPFEFLTMDADKVPKLLPEMKPISKSVSYDEVKDLEQPDLNELNLGKRIFQRITTYMSRVSEEAPAIEKAGSSTQKKAKEKPEKVEKTRTDTEFMRVLKDGNCDDCKSLELVKDRGLIEMELMKVRLKENLDEDIYKKLLDFAKFAAEIDDKNIEGNEEKVREQIRNLELNVEEADNLKEYAGNLSKRLEKLIDQDEPLEALIAIGRMEKSKKLIPYFEFVSKVEYEDATSELSEQRKKEILKEAQEIARKINALPKQKPGETYKGRKLDYKNYTLLIGEEIEEVYSRQVGSFAHRYVQAEKEKILIETDDGFKPLKRNYMMQYKYRQAPADIEVKYMPKKIHLKASTPAQGTHEIDIDKPENIFDVYQLQDVVSSLDYEEGFNTSVAFFDIQEIQSFSYSTDEGSKTALKLKPRYLKADILVLEESEFQFNNENIDGYKVKVLFRGDFSNHPFVRRYKKLQYDEESGEGFAIFHISEDGNILKVQKRDSYIEPYSFK